MSTWRYFVTEKDADAKVGEMMRERRALRENLVRLEDELRKYAASWLELGKEGSELARRSFEFGDKELRILNPSQSNAEIAAIPWAHLDSESIKRLLGDIQQTTRSLEDKDKVLSAFE
jgi:hypothetical protein